MGLKCSLLGHSFDPAGVERDREEEGNEVVTVVRELERCSRCGEERVVSESTEVTAVVDADDVDAAVDADDTDDTDAAASSTAGADEPESDDRDDADSIDADPIDAADEEAAAVDELAEDPIEEAELDARDPEEDDAEILTDDEPDREPGEWPEDAPDDAGDREEAPPVDLESDVEDPDEEALSGITVPEGAIVCPECGFEVDAESSYRDGDPCPECGAWLTVEPDE